MTRAHFLRVPCFNFEKIPFQSLLNSCGRVVIFLSRDFHLNRGCHCPENSTYFICIDDTYYIFPLREFRTFMTFLIFIL